MANFFSKLIDNVVGRPSMERTRDYRMEAMREMYDPSQLDPLASRQKSKAMEGLDFRVGQQARRQASNTLFAPMDTSYIGGNAARALSMQNMRSMQGMKNVSQMETNLSMEDQRLRDMYGDQYTNTVVEQGQLSRQRNAGIAQENASFNEELSMRRRQLGSSVASFAVDLGLTAATGGFSQAAKAGSQTVRSFDLSPFRRNIPNLTFEPLSFKGFTPSSLKGFTPKS